MRINHDCKGSTHIYLEDEDLVFVHQDSSSEVAIWVRKNKDTLIIGGPLNRNSKEKMVSLEGWALEIE